MKKLKVLFLLTIIVLGYCLSGYEIDLNSDRLSISGNPGELVTNEITVGLGRFTQVEIAGLQQGGAVGSPALPHFSQAVSLPESGNWQVTKLTYDVKEIDIDHPVLPSGWEDLTSFDTYRGNDWYPSNVVKISEPALMRDFRFSQVSVMAVQYNAEAGKLRLIQNLELELEIDYSNTTNQLTGKLHPASPAFTQLAESMIYGVDNFRSDNDYAGSILVICRSSILSYLEIMMEWKRQLGYRTYIATTSETGTSTTSIKNYIENAYDNWDYPPDHVLLVGDVTGSYSIPAFYCEGYMYPYDVTDHNYSLLSGTDYFPDVLIGRISIISTSQLATAIAKVINYESDPYMSNTDWYTKGLMMSVIDDGWGQEYYSGRETVICAGNKLLDFTYTEVDTFIAPDQSSASQLRNLINTGYTFLNYRGFGSTYYWSGAWGGHMFEINNINSLSNGWMLPMVTSIVCGGGDFADDNYQTCFGETWVVSGSSSNPRGAIAFIGPSEHDTKTPFNNCNDLGIYQGITQEGIFGASAMMLRGKMELYNNYPYCHAWGDALDSDQFYFYVYNLLGDPSVQIWTDVPKTCEMVLNSEIPQGQNYLEVSVTSEDNQLEGFRISITSEDEIIAVGMTNSSGNAYIPFAASLGDYTVTASQYGYIPAEEEIEITDADLIGVSEYSTSNTPQAGESAQLNVTIHNYSNTAATGITGHINCYDNCFYITDDTATLDILAAGGQATLSFGLTADDQWIDGREGQIFCNLSSSLGTLTSMMPLTIQSAELTLEEIEIVSPSSYLEQNTVCAIDLELLNSGSIASELVEATLISLDNNAVVTQGISSYNSINASSSGNNNPSFEILPADLPDGYTANLQLTLSVDGDVKQTIPISIPIGDINEESPTYDSYGYMAIESSDEGLQNVPEYFWEEISPYAGGQGTYLDDPHMHETEDGWIDQLDLPFDFQYYGETFDRITVCQNGYFSFGNANTFFFRNKSIPSAYGPGGMVCPFWDDLTQGYVYYWHDQANHRFFIEWKNMRLVYSQNQRQYFEVVLYDPEYYPTSTGDGEILFLYQQVNNNDYSDNYASVGIESPDKTQGLQITFADIYPDTVHELDDETAILFTPVQETTGGVMYGDVDANGAVEAFDASIALQYFVGIDPGAVAPLPWPQWRITRSDVDGNGVVEAFDGSLILQYFVGIINQFPIENTRRK